MIAIWCIVNEIWSMTNRMFCYFGPFFALNPLTTEKIKVLKKWKKCFEILIILQMCTINDNHMLYGPWDVEHDGQDFLSLWAIFCPFTTLSPLPPPPPPQKKKTLKKSKFWKKQKKLLEISPFYTDVLKIMIMCYTVSEMQCATDVSLGYL